MASVYEQNDSTATKLVKRYVLQLQVNYRATFDAVRKGGNGAPVWLKRGQCECSPAGVWVGGTSLLWHGTEQLAWPGA